MEFVFEEIKAPVTGDDPIGEPPAELIPTIRLKMTHPKSPDSASLIVVSAIESNGKVIAVEATCLWKERTIWEKRLVNLAGSLQSTEAK